MGGGEPVEGSGKIGGGDDGVLVAGHRRVGYQGDGGQVPAVGVTGQEEPAGDPEQPSAGLIGLGGQVGVAAPGDGERVGGDVLGLVSGDAAGGETDEVGVGGVEGRAGQGIG